MTSSHLKELQPLLPSESLINMLSMMLAFFVTSKLIDFKMSLSLCLVLGAICGLFAALAAALASGLQ